MIKFSSVERGRAACVRKAAGDVENEIRNSQRLARLTSSSAFFGD
jgi:hypothetical protein